MSADLTMVERVARAICPGYSDPDGINQNSPNGKQWGLYIPEARAAIAAMRECTPKMIEYGNDCFDGCRDGCQMAARHIWLSMLDAALEEKE